MTQEEMRGTIQTVLGPIAPAQLGPTLMHEHLLCDITPPKMAGDERAVAGNPRSRRVSSTSSTAACRTRRRTN